MTLFWNYNLVHTVEAEMAEWENHISFGPREAKENGSSHTGSVWILINVHYFTFKTL